MQVVNLPQPLFLSCYKWWKVHQYNQKKAHHHKWEKFYLYRQKVYCYTCLKRRVSCNVVLRCRVTTMQLEPVHSC
ncbi:hypothetical protein HOLleu_01359 [Holothuria leucospilota]|uniref:Uncharacterized protein n=1 Tax=Holothuria leucospilota TaxID=206669 RepID=A0A9Q1CNB4_HOLLE|nr:hypothetical protein HOLleu_01359 [Holothuria leucospilota]